MYELGRFGALLDLVYPNELIKESENVENVSAAIYSHQVTKKKKKKCVCIYEADIARSHKARITSQIT